MHSVIVCAIDDLSYTYNGNQVIKIDDDAVDPVYNGCFNFKDGADEDIEYEYDQNGNLTMDLNREICSIAYNCLNLPQRIDYQDGSYVLYTYNAGGEKMRTDYYINPLPNMVPQVNGGTGMNRNANLQHTRVDYCGNLVYENDTLKQALFEGGYVTFNGTTPQYHFYVQDHQGNNRLVCDESGAIEQVNHYYPYGGLMGESEDITSTQRYKYNGKELDRMHGLNLYDYSARQYDAAVGKFTTMDPLCEKYYNVSPYAYCVGNPVNYVDPDGCKPTRREAAIMANHIYNPKKELGLKYWRVSTLLNDRKDIQLSTSNGLSSTLYEKVVDGKIKEYAYVTRGTDSGRDWIENVAQVFGSSKEFSESASNARKISDLIGKDTELTYIGHSQGGAEAALNSLVTSGDDVKGREAITFNAAGLSKWTKLFNGGLRTLFKSEQKIDANIMLTCPLNFVQNMPNFLPQVDGNTHLLMPKDLNSVINGHSIKNVLKSIE